MRKGWSDAIAAAVLAWQARATQADIEVGYICGRLGQRLEPNVVVTAGLTLGPGEQLDAASKAAMVARSLEELGPMR